MRLGKVKINYKLLAYCFVLLVVIQFPLGTSSSGLWAGVPTSTSSVCVARLDCTSGRASLAGLFAGWIYETEFEQFGLEYFIIKLSRTRSQRITKYSATTGDARHKDMLRWGKRRLSKQKIKEITVSHKKNHQVLICMFWWFFKLMEFTVPLFLLRLHSSKLLSTFVLVAGCFRAGPRHPPTKLHIFYAMLIYNVFAGTWIEGDWHTISLLLRMQQHLEGNYRRLYRMTFTFLMYDQQQRVCAFV